MDELSDAFRRRLEPLFAALASELGRRPFRIRLDATAHAVRLAGDEVQVPVRFEVHWRRFGTVPTDLVRDAAYAACRGQPKADEADCQAFAEVFLRDHVLRADQSAAGEAPDVGVVSPRRSRRRQ